MDGIKVLAFDTGGTILDWHSGIVRVLVETGAFTELDETLRPDCFLARSDPRDVARVEDRTYIASVDDPGPTNNWREPDALRAELRDRFRDAKILVAGPNFGTGSSRPTRFISWPARWRLSVRSLW